MFLAFCACTVGMAFAQRTVTGTVLDGDSGEPVMGASVLVVGTSSLGQATNEQGKFTINNVPNDAKLLRVSFVGMIDREVAIKNNLRIFLQPDTKVTDEVLVVAYGTQKRSAFTGSAVEIKAEDITSHVATSATSALVGKVAGLTATSGDGGPGSSPTVRIRGIGSMSASSSPLVIVDGAPYDGGLSTINPNDIESISVLKDASSSAIYGARGANGVIIVTTKRGSNRDAEIRLDAKWGSNSRLIPQYDVITDPAQYIETHYRSMYNSQVYASASAADAYAYADANILNNNNGGLGYQIYTVPAGEKLVGTNFKLNPNATLGYSDGTNYFTPDNWYDETFHNSFRQEYNVTVNGKGDNLGYYANVGYLDDGGIVDHSEYQRYTARTNVDYQAKKWLKLSTNLGFTHTDTQTPSYGSTWGSSGNVFYITNTIAPIFPLYVRNADGTIKKENGRTVYDANQTAFSRPNFVGNAVRDNEYNRYKGYVDLFTGKWQALITPFEGLTLNASYSVMSENSRSNSLYSRFGSGSSVDGAAYVSSSRYFTNNQLYTANYHTTIADVHGLDVLAGYEQYKVLSQGLNGYNDHLYNPFIAELNNATARAQMSTGSSTARYMTEGFFGRFQYDYAEKYFLDGSIRRDASSRFAPGHRWGTFGSVGAAWQLNKEAFLKDVEWIDLLKFKVSWGSMGNDGVSNYASSYVPYADMYSASYNEETGEYLLNMSQKGNTELTWETNNQFNIGFDFSFFKYRLNGTLEWYNRKTTDMLFTKEFPLSSGITAPYYPLNVGSMTNRGIELALNGIIIRNQDWEWSADLNLNHFINKVNSLDKSVEAEGIKTGNRIIRVGGSIYNSYLRQFAGVEKEGKTYYEGTNHEITVAPGQGLYYIDNTYYYDMSGNEITAEKAAELGEGNYTSELHKKEVTTDIGAATQYDLGTTLPDLVGGFSTTLKYRDFDLSAGISFQLGGHIYDGAYQAYMHMGANAGTNLHKDLLKAWSPENPNSNIPRLSTAAGDWGSTQTSVDRYLTSSNYLSLNNVTFGYTLPKSLILPIGISALRVYVAGENLVVLTKRKGLDPRFNYGIGSMTAGSGLQSTYYAGMRTVTAGLTLSF